MAERFRIHELAVLVERAVSAQGTVPSSGRIRATPDVRTLRYYTTIGLLDGPLELRGRTAFYGRRHVWQLVAIKRLQADGLPLHDIQHRLVGLENRELSRLAALPTGFFDDAQEFLSKTLPQEVAEEPAQPVQRTERFWESTIAAGSQSQRPTGSLLPKTGLLVPLGKGVSLALEGVPPSALDNRVWRRLQPAIDELLKVLRDSGLQSTE